MFPFLELEKKPGREPFSDLTGFLICLSVKPDGEFCGLSFVDKK